MLTHDQVVEVAKKYPIESYRVGGEPKYNPWLFDFARDIERASAAPAEGREPTGDELRKLVREIRDASGGPSDAPQPADYVLGGWRAAITTAPTKPAEGRSEYAKGYYDGCLHGPRAASTEGKANDVQILSDGFSSCDSSGNHSARDIRIGIATAPTMGEAARDVLAERRRQVEAEGWTPEHDDKHISGEMAKAAAAYALNAGNVAPGWPQDPLRAFCEPPTFWPWNREWWKPDTLRWMLVKAGALILAEIERIDRAAAKGGSDAD